MQAIPETAPNPTAASGTTAGRFVQPSPTPLYRAVQTKMASDYVYDVFISYRRKQPVMDWMRLHFFPLLEVILPECMPRAPRIFIDWETETGAEWPARLAQALATSRCLLPVWSPQYFRSP